MAFDFRYLSIYHLHITEVVKLNNANAITYVKSHTYITGLQYNVVFNVAQIDGTKE